MPQRPAWQIGTRLSPWPTSLSSRARRRRQNSSERDADMHLIRAWRHEMSAAECREEIVKGFLVRQVDDAETQAHLGFASVEEVVGTEAQVEQMARRSARRVGHIVCRALRRNLQPRGATA